MIRVICDRAACHTSEEVAAYLAGETSLEQAIDQLSFVFGGRTVTAGASAGIAILDLHAEAGKALEEADRAMYVRKAQRRHEGSRAVVADQWAAQTRAR